MNKNNSTAQGESKVKGHLWERKGKTTYLNTQAVMDEVVFLEHSRHIG